MGPYFQFVLAPLFLYLPSLKRGAGLSPAITFLLATPAINPALLF
jgi:uncharacterized membrane protein YraQ (UPF0718 family)